MDLSECLQLNPINISSNVFSVPVTSPSALYFVINCTIHVTKCFAIPSHHKCMRSGVIMPYHMLRWFPIGISTLVQPSATSHNPALLRSSRACWTIPRARCSIMRIVFLRKRSVLSKSLHANKWPDTSLRCSFVAQQNRHVVVKDSINLKRVDTRFEYVAKY